MISSPPSVTVVVPALSPDRLPRLLDSLARQTASLQTIVVDNGSPDASVGALCGAYDGVEVLTLERNEGYSRACNLGAAKGDGDVLVLVNDDCVLDPEFVAELAAPIDTGSGVAMSAGVMRDWADAKRIDSAGMELDRTLLVFDYLNGEPISLLDSGVADPVGPSGAAAGFDRATFLAEGGFDERLFAYWEDVDLVLRLRARGFICALAAGARGVHEHSATLGSGSAKKNYLMGFGRGYVLRKWEIVRGAQIAEVLVRDGVLCVGQALFDGNIAGVRGRVRGWQAAGLVPHATPPPLPPSAADGLLSNLRRRARRRAGLHARVAADPSSEAAADDGKMRSLAVFHIADTSGPSRSLENELAWLAGEGSLDAVIPGQGNISDVLAKIAYVHTRDYEALTQPSLNPVGFAGDLRRMGGQVQGFRRLIRECRPDLVIAVTSMLPTVPIAARLEGVPVLVYCGELYDRGFGVGPLRGAAGRMLGNVTGRLANAIIACSGAVAGQFERVPSDAIETVYPPVGLRYTGGDAAAFRELHEIAPDAPCVASVGYLTEGRGQDLLIRATPAILRAVADARILIAGDPFPRPQDLAFRQYLQELVDQLGLRDSVILAGHVENVDDLYAAADVVVNPARFNEPFGRVPFEAGIAGTAAVVTRVGAIPELLRNGESALIVEPEDPTGLAQAVIRMLIDAELRQRLAAGAARVATERLTPQQSLAGFQRAVRAALRPRA